MPDVLTPDELRDLLALLLAGTVGGSQATWHSKVGPVMKQPMHGNIACNWTVAGSGTPANLEGIAGAVEVVRSAHPYTA